VKAAFYTELIKSCMIKHDYKPQNNKRFFDKGFFDHIPAWATHPYMIISMAVLVMALAFLLSKDNQIDEPSIPKSIPLTETGEIIIQAPDATSIESTPLIDSGQGSKSIDYSDPIDIPLQLESTLIPDSELKSLDIDRKWKKTTVKKGDNLSLIFKRIGLSAQMVHKIISLDANTSRLKRLRPGEILNYQLDVNKQLLALKYVIDLQQTLFVERTSGDDKTNYQFTSRITNKTIEYRTAYVDGVITDSLYMSGKRAGLSDTLVVNLANIFDWDIDFILDIRSGDSFSVLYQEKFLDGEKIGNGDIIAAEFINQGDSYRAVRYTDSKKISNYYTPDGLSMRKAFLRAPIKFSYISSGFKPRRFHPILKRWKAHRGIDYRANTGTPIRAAGDGKVTHSSSNKYNGKYVFIQHGQGIITKYLHMSRRAVSRGKRVKQGQVIGYVGATGLAEAPHLHYEFLVNGVHRNPRTVKLPKAEPISKSEKTAFTASSAELINQLVSRKQIQSNTQVAK
jgi:murein DD-endopeptidase MepM/ murein hydrolase activator NlpD